ncbi:MAG: hypothetical protein FWD33_02810 [Alphaproteobacteria bacterium]|nr:hypothetical protein [Alphaproteobacteria bacterium]
MPKTQNEKINTNPDQEAQENKAVVEKTKWLREILLTGGIIALVYLGYKAATPVHEWRVKNADKKIAALNKEFGWITMSQPEKDSVIAHYDSLIQYCKNRIKDADGNGRVYRIIRNANDNRNKKSKFRIQEAYRVAMWRLEEQAAPFKLEGNRLERRSKGYNRKLKKLEDKKQQAVYSVQQSKSLLSGRLPEAISLQRKKFAKSKEMTGDSWNHAVKTAQNTYASYFKKMQKEIKTK